MAKRNLSKPKHLTAKRKIKRLAEQIKLQSKNIERWKDALKKLQEEVKG